MGLLSFIAGVFGSGDSEVSGVIDGDAPGSYRELVAAEIGFEPDYVVVNADAIAAPQAADCDCGSAFAGYDFSGEMSC